MWNARIGSIQDKAHLQGKVDGAGLWCLWLLTTPVLAVTPWRW